MSISVLQRFAPICHIDNIGHASGAGSEVDAQRVDEMADEGPNSRKFFLQYYFPPSCVGETGRVVRSGEDFVATIAELSAAPARLARLSAAARIEAARRHSPVATARALADAYRVALSGMKRSRPFHEILGLHARAWFESSVAELMSEGAVRLVASLAAAKGNLAHFRACFPADSSLAGWMPAASQVGGYSPVKSSGSLITRFGA